jgi:hypothetical protein
MMQSDRLSIVTSMTGVSRSGAGGTRRRAAGTRRTGWFSHEPLEVRSEDQEDEVRAQLYARPAESERTVRRVERVAPAQRVEWLERPERIEHSEPVAPGVDRMAARPAA